MNALPQSRIVMRNVETGATEVFDRACGLAESEQFCALYNRLYSSYFHFTAVPIQA